MWITYVFSVIVFVMPLCASVYLCLVVTYWERADLLTLVFGVYLSLSLSHWYPGPGVVLDLSISDLCTLTYFHTVLFTQTYIKESYVGRNVEQTT